MTLNCSVLLSIQTMTQLDSNYNADLLDAMADIAYEQEQAMRESSQDDWNTVDRTDGIVSVDLLNDYGFTNELNPIEQEPYDDRT
jgi:hypothetical protein